jgi:hypothetical protein
MPKVNISATVAPSPQGSGTPLPTILPATLAALEAGAVNLSAANVTISTPEVSTQWVFLRAQEVFAEPIPSPRPTIPVVEEGLRISPEQLTWGIVGGMFALGLICVVINIIFRETVKKASSRFIHGVRAASSRMLGKEKGPVTTTNPLNVAGTLEDVQK